jgi:hypothetical protein
MGVLHWPAEAPPPPAEAATAAASSSPSAPPPPLVHDPTEDIPHQHLKWAVAIVHATPALARLFAPQELEVREGGTVE